MITPVEITPIQTSIVQPGDDLEQLLDQSISKLAEQSILAVTSKVIALCEGRVVEKKTGEKAEKHAVAIQESEQYLDPNQSQYNLLLTVKDGVLAINAGVDESNVADRYYVLLPKDSFATARRIWRWGRKRFKLKEFGVIVTDSRTIPLKWGVLGTALGYCGFEGLRSEIGQPDLFGHTLHMTTINHAEALAVAACYVGGEAAEAQPLVVITDIPNIKFRQSPPSKKEREVLKIVPTDDAYWPLLSSVAWKPGGAAVKSKIG